jgi:hypothetical protein
LSVKTHQILKASRDQARDKMSLDLEAHRLGAVIVTT